MPDDEEQSAGGRVPRAGALRASRMPVPYERTTPRIVRPRPLATASPVTKTPTGLFSIVGRATTPLRGLISKVTGWGGSSPASASRLGADSPAEDEPSAAAQGAPTRMDGGPRDSVNGDITVGIAGGAATGENGLQASFNDDQSIACDAEYVEQRVQEPASRPSTSAHVDVAAVLAATEGRGGADAAAPTRSFRALPMSRNPNGLWGADAQHHRTPAQGAPPVNLDTPFLRVRALLNRPVGRNPLANGAGETPSTSLRPAALPAPRIAAPTPTRDRGAIAGGAFPLTPLFAEQVQPSASAKQPPRPLSQRQSALPIGGPRARTEIEPVEATAAAAPAEALPRWSPMRSSFLAAGAAGKAQITIAAPASRKRPRDASDAENGTAGVGTAGVGHIRAEPRRRLPSAGAAAKQPRYTSETARRILQALDSLSAEPAPSAAPPPLSDLVLRRPVPPSGMARLPAPQRPAAMPAALPPPGPRLPDPPAPSQRAPTDTAPPPQRSSLDGGAPPSDAPATPTAAPPRQSDAVFSFGAAPLGGSSAFAPSPMFGFGAPRVPDNAQHPSSEQACIAPSSTSRESREDTAAGPIASNRVADGTAAKRPDSAADSQQGPARGPSALPDDADAGGDTQQQQGEGREEALFGKTTGPTADVIRRLSADIPDGVDVEAAPRITFPFSAPTPLPVPKNGVHKRPEAAPAAAPEAPTPPAAAEPAPAPVASGWGSAFLAANKAKAAQATKAVEEAINAANGGLDAGAPSTAPAPLFGLPTPGAAAADGPASSAAATVAPTFGAVVADGASTALGKPSETASVAGVEPKATSTSDGQDGKAAPSSEPPASGPSQAPLFGLGFADAAPSKPAAAPFLFGLSPAAPSSSSQAVMDSSMPSSSAPAVSTAQAPATAPALFGLSAPSFPSTQASSTGLSLFGAAPTAAVREAAGDRSDSDGKRQRSNAEPAASAPFLFGAAAPALFGASSAGLAAAHSGPEAAPAQPLAAPLFGLISTATAGAASSSAPASAAASSTGATLFQTQPASSAAPLVNFGSTAAASSSAVMLFGATAPPLGGLSFGSAASQGFSFGAASSGPQLPSAAAAQQPPSLFGSVPAPANTEPAFAAETSLGEPMAMDGSPSGSAAPNTTPLFGSAPQSNPFGASPLQPSGGFPFGAAAAGQAPPLFGSTALQPSAAPQQPPAAPFMFGGPSQLPGTSSFAFGAQQSAPAFGASGSGFSSFGGSGAAFGASTSSFAAAAAPFGATQPAFGAQQPTANPFAGGAAPAASFAFGAGPQQAPVQTAFSAAPVQQPAVNFGLGAQPPAAANPFGAGANAVFSMGSMGQPESTTIRKKVKVARRQAR